MAMGDSKQRDVSPLHSVMAAVSYGVVSVVMTFSNKAVLTTYAFDFENTLLSLQMAVTIFLLYALHLLKWLKLQPITFDRTLRISPVAILYACSVGFALASLSYLSVPIYNTLKRLTTVVVLMAEQIIMGKTTSNQIKLSVLLTVIGALMTGRGDLEFDGWGYFFAGLAIFFQAGYLILVAKVGSTGLDTFNILYYTSFISLPFLMLLAVITGEHEQLSSFPDWTDAGFLSCLVFTLVQGALLNFTLFYCTTINSALTTTIVGQLKVILSTLIGFFTFGGAVMNTEAYCGLVVNTIGGCYYSYVKYTEKFSTHTAPKNQVDRSV